jgi:hypothetical protein
LFDFWYESESTVINAIIKLITILNKDNKIFNLHTFTQSYRVPLGTHTRTHAHTHTHTTPALIPSPNIYPQKETRTKIPTHCFAQIAAKDVTLENGVLSTVAMATGESEALPLWAVGRAPGTEQNAVDSEASDVRIVSRIKQPETRHQTTHP